MGTGVRLWNLAGHGLFFRVRISSHLPHRMCLPPVILPIGSLSGSPLKIYNKMDSSTLQPAEVAVAIIQQAVTKHNTQYDKVFVKAILAGVILSFGSLFDFIVQGGSPSLTSTNPGIVKLLGGFVFPVGLVAYGPLKYFMSPLCNDTGSIESPCKDSSSSLVTLWWVPEKIFSRASLTSRMQIFPMAVLNGSLPWWSIPTNWVIGLWDLTIQMQG